MNLSNVIDCSYWIWLDQMNLVMIFPYIHKKYYTQMMCAILRFSLRAQHADDPLRAMEASAQ